MQRMNNIWPFGANSLQPGMINMMSNMGQSQPSILSQQISPAQIYLLQQHLHQQQQQQQQNAMTNQNFDLLALQQQYLNSRVLSGICPSRIPPQQPPQQQQSTNNQGGQTPFTSSFSVNSLLNPFVSNNDKLQQQQQQQNQQQQQQIAAAVLGQHLVAAVTNYRLHLNNKNQRANVNVSESAFQPPAQKRQKTTDPNETDFNSATFNSSICSISSPSSTSSSASFEFSNPELANNSHGSDLRYDLNNETSLLNESTGEIINDENNQRDLFLSPESLNNSECKKRKRTANKKRTSIDLQNIGCPICGVSLRVAELHAHLETEIELFNNEDIETKRVIVKSEERSDEQRKMSFRVSEKSVENDQSESNNNHGRYLTYLMIKENRELRLKKRKLFHRTKESNDQTSNCHLCNDNVSGDLNSHLENCLKRKNNQDLDRSTSITSDSNHKDIYNRRKRFKTIKELEKEEEFELESTDEKCRFDDSSSDKDLNTIFEIKRTDTSNSTESYSNSSQKLEESDASFEVCDVNNSEDAEADSAAKSKSTCQICSESYKKAMISVNCWHVHCKNCWFKSLSNEKLCPQCKTITLPSDLRKIFL